VTSPRTKYPLKEKEVLNPTVLEMLKEHQKPLRKWPFIIVFIILFGIILSICNNEWSWFSRSGSLVVICGLLSARWDFTNKINEENLDILDPVIIRNMKKNGGIINAQRIENIKKELRTRIVEYTKPKYRAVEFIMIAIGTFIWGFGDLIGVIIK